MGEIKFEVGKRYCFFSSDKAPKPITYLVEKRTNKTIVLTNSFNETIRRRIFRLPLVDVGMEFVKLNDRKGTKDRCLWSYYVVDGDKIVDLRNKN